MLCKPENYLKSAKIVLNYLKFITALISRAKCHFTLIRLTSLCLKFHSPSKNQIKKENKTTNLTSSLEIFKCQKLPPEIIKIHPLVTSEAFFCSPRQSLDPNSFWRPAESHSFSRDKCSGKICSTNTDDDDECSLFNWK